MEADFGRMSARIVPYAAVIESVALPAIPRAIFRWALSYDVPIENDTNSKVVESKMDSSITAVRIFRSLTFVKMYFHIIFKMHLLSIGGGILQCVLDCLQYGVTGKCSAGYRIDL